MTHNPNSHMPDVSVKSFNPPVLDKPRYPISALEKVKVLTSADEFKSLMGGVQPPPFDEDFRFAYDPSIPIGVGGLTKSWIDTAPFESGLLPTANVTYHFVKLVNGVSVIGQMSMTVAAAANYNMPNQHKYEKFTIPPTQAWFIAPNTNQPTGVNPAYIITEDKAKALAEEINLDCGFSGAAAVTIVMGTLPGLPDAVTDSVNWEDDPRRPWKLKYTDTTESNAMEMYTVRNKAGIDTPGKFAVADAFHGGKPNWIADTEVTVAGTIPTPIRLPVSGQEEIVGGGLTATEVVRIDLEQPYTPQPGFEADVIARLERIEQALK